MSAFASINDFRLRYGGSVPTADVARIDMLLADASTLIREAVDDDYLDDVFPDLFTIICVEAARRAYDNPQGLTGETIGNYTWRGSGSGGALFLTAAELKAVRKAAGKTGARSVTLSNDLPYVSVSDSDIW